MKITNVSELTTAVNTITKNFPATAEVYVKQGYEGFYLIAEENDTHREVFSISD